MNIRSWCLWASSLAVAFLSWNSSSRADTAPAPSPQSLPSAETTPAPSSSAPNAASAAPSSAVSSATPATAASAPTSVGRRASWQGQAVDDYYRADTWDLDIQLGGGRFWGERDASWLGFARVRAGLLHARLPVLTMIGATYEYSTLTPATFGIQAEALLLESGLWAQLGGMLDLDARPGASLSLGLSVVGIEGQVRSYADEGPGGSLLAKIRIPVGLIVYAFQRHSAPR